MNCKYCNNELNKSQIYDVLRGKRKQTCSRSCGNLMKHYGTINNAPPRLKNRKGFKKKCIVCNDSFITTVSKQKICGAKCSGVLISKRMKTNNPMNCIKTRGKVSKTLKEINHKPIIKGGNGRGATIQQLKIYNEIIKIDNSFQMELIEKTGVYRKQYNAPTHYKIDIASNIHKLAIEIDGNSHSSIKVQECDKRKTKILTLKGWKVLRLSNNQIDKDIKSCVQMVLSMI